ncbi:MAG: pyridoxamine 5'-phosphate oxidase family protein [Thermodesulfobacteriota bacterium]|nr:pyridoxamine 5'-phosphate oxidase family protein [Thermodesulfobacteriota bacterium]
MIKIDKTTKYIYGECREIEEKILNYIQSYNCMSLATGGEIHSQAATVFFANKEFTFYFLSTPDTRHTKNIARDGRVAVTINGDYYHWKEIKGVQIEGKAHLITDAKENKDALTVYLKKFPYLFDLLFKDKRSEVIVKDIKEINWYSLNPLKVRYISNDPEFGRREEIYFEGKIDKF